MAEQKLFIEIMGEARNYEQSINKAKQLSANFAQYTMDRSKIVADFERRTTNATYDEASRARKKAEQELEANYRKSVERARGNVRELAKVEDQYQKDRKKLSIQADEAIKQARLRAFAGLEQEISGMSKRQAEARKQDALKALRERYDEERKLAQNNALEIQRINKQQTQDEGQVKSMKSKPSGGFIKKAREVLDSDSILKNSATISFMGDAFDKISGVIGGVTDKIKEFKNEAREAHDGMVQIKSLLSEEQSKGLPDTLEKLRDISVKTGQPLAELQKSAYLVISGIGGMGDNLEATTSIVEKATKAGIALGASTNATTLAMINLGNAANLNMADLKNQDLVLDTIANTMKQGVIPSGEALAAAIGKTAPAFSSMDKNGARVVKQIGAMTTIMTQNGVSIDEAQTQMRAFSMELSNNATRAKLVEAGLKGIDGATGEIKDWTALWGSLGKETKNYVDIMSSSEAKNATNIFAKNASQNILDLSDSMENAEGTTQQMYDIMASSHENLVKRREMATKNFKVTIGEYFTSFAEGGTKSADMVTSAMIKLNEWLEPIEKKFDKLVKKTTEFNNAANNLSGLSTSIGEAISGGEIAPDAAKGFFKEIKSHIDEIKAASPELATELTKLLNNPANQTAEGLGKIKLILDQVAASSKQMGGVSAFEAQEKAVDKFREKFQESFSIWEKIKRAFSFGGSGSFADTDVSNVFQDTKDEMDAASEKITQIRTEMDELTKAGMIDSVAWREKNLLLIENQKIVAENQKGVASVNQATDEFFKDMLISADQVNSREEYQLLMKQKLQNISVGVMEHLKEMPAFMERFNAKAKEGEDALFKQKEISQAISETQQNMANLRGKEIGGLDAKEAEKMRMELISQLDTKLKMQGLSQDEIAKEIEKAGLAENYKKILIEQLTLELTMKQARMEAMTASGQNVDKSLIAEEAILQKKLSQIKGEYDKSGALQQYYNLQLQSLRAEEAILLAKKNIGVELTSEEQALLDYTQKKIEQVQLEERKAQIAQFSKLSEEEKKNIQEAINQKVQEGLQGQEKTIANQIEILNKLKEQYNQQIQTLIAKDVLSDQEKRQIGYLEEARVNINNQVNGLEAQVQVNNVLGAQIVDRIGKLKEEEATQQGKLDLAQLELELKHEMGQLSDVEFQAQSLDILKQRVSVEQEILNAMIAQGAAQGAVLEQSKKVMSARIAVARSEKQAKQQTQRTTQQYKAPEREEKSYQTQQAQAQPAEKAAEHNYEPQMIEHQYRIERFAEALDEFHKNVEETNKLYYEEIAERKRNFEEDVDFQRKMDDERTNWMRTREGITNTFMDKMAGIVKSLKSLTIGERFAEIDSELGKMVSQFREQNQVNLDKLKADQAQLKQKMQGNQGSIAEIQNKSGVDMIAKMNYLNQLGDMNSKEFNTMTQKEKEGAIESFRKNIWENLTKWSQEELAGVIERGKNYISGFKDEINTINKQLSGFKGSKAEEAALKTQQIYAKANLASFQREVAIAEGEKKRRDEIIKTNQKEIEQRKKASDQLSQEYKENEAQIKATTEQMERYNKFSGAAMKVQETKDSLNGLMDTIYELGKTTDIITQTYLLDLINRFKEVGLGSIVGLSEDLEKLNIKEVFSNAMEITAAQVKLDQKKNELAAIQVSKDGLELDQMKKKLAFTEQQIKAGTNKEALGKLSKFATSRGDEFTETAGERFNNPLYIGPAIEAFRNSPEMKEMNDRYNAMSKQLKTANLSDEEQKKLTEQINLVKDNLTKAFLEAKKIDTTEYEKYRAIYDNSITNLDKLKKEKEGLDKSINLLGKTVSGKTEGALSQVQEAQEAYDNLTKDLAEKEIKRQKQLGEMINTIKATYNISFDAAKNYLAILPLIEAESNARIGNFRLFTDELKDAITDIDKMRNEAGKAVQNPLISINFEESLALMKQGVDMQKQLLLDNITESDLVRAKIQIYEEQYKTVIASLEAQIKLQQTFVEEAKAANMSDLKDKEARLLALKKEKKAIEDINTLSDPAKKQLQIKADIDTLTKNLEMKRLIFETEQAELGLYANQADSILKTIELNDAKIEGLERILVTEGKLSDEQRKQLSEAKKAASEAKNRRAEQISNIDYKGFGDLAKNISKDVKLIESAFEEGGDQIQYGINGTIKLANSAVNLTKEAITEISTLSKALSGGSTKEGLVATGNLMSKIGQAFLSSGIPPLEIIGGVILLGGGITSLVGSLMGEAEKIESKFKINTQGRADTQEHILSIYENELDYLQRMEDLESELYDTAEERLAAEKEAYNNMIAKNVEAQKYANMSNEELVKTEKQKKDDKEALEQKKRILENLKGKSASEIQAFLKTVEDGFYAISDFAFDDMMFWGDTKKAQDILKSNIDDYIKSIDTQQQAVEIELAAIGAIVDYRIAEKQLQEEINDGNIEAAEKLMEVLEKIVDLEREKLEYQLAMGQIDEVRYNADLLALLEKQLQNASNYYKTLQGGSDEQIEAQKEIWGLEMQISELKNQELKTIDRRIDFEKRRFDFLLKTKQITQEQYDANVLSLLELELEKQKEYVATVIAQATKEEQVIAAMEEQWNIESEIYNLKNKENKLDDEKLKKMKELSREYNRRLLAERMGGAAFAEGDKTALQNQIIDEMRKAGATEEQINRQIATFQNTLPQFAEGGDTGEGGLAMLHPQEKVLNKSAKEAFDTMYPGLLDAVNNDSGALELMKGLGTLGRSQQALEVTKMLIFNNYTTTVNLGGIVLNYGGDKWKKSELNATAELINKTIERKFEGVGVHIGK